MRAPTLQYFYLQKPLTLLLLIAAISTLCWIGCGEFYTKGEPREASVAVSMLEKNNWILPQVYADELAYKPPLTHWLMAVFSMPGGEVTPFTSRLPSALAFIFLIGICFIFFGRNLKSQEAFLACLILLTSFELHRSAMTARVDMLLTFFIILGLMRLFRWEERKDTRGFPIEIPIILGLAALTKGPVGILLPLLVFGVYLLLLRYNCWKIIVKLVPIALSSLVLPGIWYYLAYKTGGKEFTDLVWAENFGRFLGSDDLNIQYNLGHTEPVWFNFVTLIAGFIPWCILLFLSLFGLKYSGKIPGLKKIWNNLLGMPKIKLFSLVSIVVIFIFYCIPSSKRSVYLMPVYPFLAIFIAQYVLYLTEYHRKIGRAFGLIIGTVGSLIVILGLLTIVTHTIDPVQLTGIFTRHRRTLADVAATWQSLNSPQILYIVLFCLLISALYVLFSQLWKKNNLKILYTTIATYLVINLVLDGIFLPAFKDGVSSKPIAEELQKIYPIEDNNVFVMNNLLEYSNMYGLNFYFHNNFRNFEKEKPEKGFLLVGKDSFQKVLQRYGNDYSFQLLEMKENKNRDGEKVLEFYSFKREITHAEFKME